MLIKKLLVNYIKEIIKEMNFENNHILSTSLNTHYASLNTTIILSPQKTIKCYILFQC